jgi:hypothetical protein
MANAITNLLTHLHTLTLYDIVVVPAVLSSQNKPKDKQARSCSSFNRSLLENETVKFAKILSAYHKIQMF